MEAQANTTAQKEPGWALRSRLLEEAGFRHAFFTRLGGVSRPPLDSLNFALNVGDAAEAVAENVRRGAAELGIEPGHLYVVSQVHGRAFVVLDGTEDRSEVGRRVADITVSKTAGVGCGIRTADCVSVLVGDRRSGAAAAIHSGWRGTADNVTAAGVGALRELVGDAGDLVAAIGPHIERCCFEVDEDVAAELSRASTLGRSAVTAAFGSAKVHVDLRAIVRAQLEELGVPAASIDDVPGCTCCDARRFYSFRRDKDQSGRMASVIVARG